MKAKIGKLIKKYKLVETGQDSRKVDWKLYGQVRQQERNFGVTLSTRESSQKIVLHQSPQKWHDINIAMLDMGNLGILIFMSLPFMCKHPLLSLILAHLSFSWKCSSLSHSVLFLQMTISFVSISIYYSCLSVSLHFIMVCECVSLTLSDMCIHPSLSFISVVIFSSHSLSFC